MPSPFSSSTSAPPVSVPALRPVVRATRQRLSGIWNAQAGFTCATTLLALVWSLAVYTAACTLGIKVP